MSENFRAFMLDATRLTRSGRLSEATQALQRALGVPVGTGNSPLNVSLHKYGGGLPSTNPRGDASLILDGRVLEQESQLLRPSGEAKGTFTTASYSHGGLTRRYKVYEPPELVGPAQAMVVMLHGCTQNPDDFALGTQMNELAHAQGVMVLYPEQSGDANPQRCWNWFKHTHQRRGSGEPAFIASLTQMLVKQNGIDPHRVYIAGLSAGGAMAAIVATAYPDMFAAVGVHSGLPCGVAGNLGEAMMLMQNGGGSWGGPPDQPSAPPSVPTIVFHGDKDQTVHPRNGEQVIAAAVGPEAGSEGAEHHTIASHKAEQGVSQQGHAYTRSTYTSAKGAPVGEHWLVHGAGHAWSGGHSKGSFTDPKGPDATREMMRFFLSQPGGSAN